jgi:hypothetical protein
VSEIREALRLWLGVVPGLPEPGLCRIARYSRVDRNAVRRYVAAGLRRDDGAEALDDELIGAVAEAVRPVRPHGHGVAWEQLLGFEEQISDWVAGDKDARPLTVAKIHTLLACLGCVVPYRMLRRFTTQRCGFGRKDTTVRVADGRPGIECQIDFGCLGMLADAADGRRGKVHALIFIAVYRRRVFVWLSYSQHLAAVIAGCQPAWEFFGGVVAVLSPDNVKPVIAAAYPLTPRLSAGWLDYAAHAGFATGVSPHHGHTRAPGGHTGRRDVRPHFGAALAPPPGCRRRRRTPRTPRLRSRFAGRHPAAHEITSHCARRRPPPWFLTSTSQKPSETTTRAPTDQKPIHGKVKRAARRRNFVM